MIFTLKNPKEYKLREELRAEGSLNIQFNRERYDFCLVSLSKVQSAGLNGVGIRNY